MEGHEDIRLAIRDHLIAVLPTQLDALRVRAEVSSPREPVAYLLSDSLQVSTAYPVVLIRTTKLDRLIDAGAGTFVARYGCEVVVACEVPTARAYEAASVDRDRLSLAVRWALLTPSSSLPAEVTLSVAGLTEDHGPAAESLAGRPLAVGVTSFAAVVAESGPAGTTGTEDMDDFDLTVTNYDAATTI